MAHSDSPSLDQLNLNFEQEQTKISTPAQDRKTCWNARDKFLSCLKNSFTSEQFYLALKESTETKTEIVPKILRKSCDQFRDLMYLSCPDSWVMADHFEKKFRGDNLKEYQLKKLKESGAQPL